MNNKNEDVIVLLDIDHTLFDTDAYRNVCFQDIIKKTNYGDSDKGLKIAEELYAKMRSSGYFKTRDFIQELCTLLAVQVEIAHLEEAFFDEVNIKKSLYSDVEEVLEMISKKGTVRIGIFSGGQEDMQRKKIASLVHILEEDHIHINEVDKLQDIPTVLEKYTNHKVFIIDDLLIVLEKFKSVNDKVITVLIERNGTKKEGISGDGFIPDLRIENLRELTTII